MRLKSCLSNKRELFYLIFFLPQMLCVSMGMGSSDFLYKVVFAIGVPFLLLSIAGTRYEKREIIVMAIVSVLTIIAFIQNRNRSLILACMAVFGCKDMDIYSILRYVFLIMTVGILATVGLSAAGILPNVALSLPKEDGVMYTIYSYGFQTANSLYFHLIVLVLLILVLFEKNIKLAGWTGITLVMYGAYKILFSRTGWVCYVCLLSAYIIYKFTGNSRMIYMRILAVIPAVLTVLNWGLICLYSRNSYVMVKLDDILNHRISLAQEAFGRYGVTLLGSRHGIQLDMLYATMLLNYGVLLSVICIIAYTRSMWKLVQDKKDMIVIAMAIISVYSFMEVNAINPMWNPFVLYLTLPLFSHSGKRSDTRGAMDGL